MFPAGMVVVVLLAAGLRLWSIGFGLPLVTHPDEPLIYDAADRMISERTLNPQWFRYPAFIIDIQAAILSAVYAIDKLIGLSTDTIRTLGYGGGRVVMAGFGIATVALTGLLGRRVTRLTLHDARTETASTTAGLVAALLMAVSFIHVKDSHYLKPDVPTGFFTALTLWFTLTAWERPDSLRRWLPVGAAVGLAAAAKYTGAAVAIVPVVALVLLLVGGRIEWQRAARIAVAMGLVSVGVFLLFNPYVLLAPGEFLSPVDGIRAELEHYRTGHDGAEGNDSWRWYLGELRRNGFGPTLTPLMLLGGALAVWQVVRRKLDAGALWLVLAFVPVYYLMIARYPVRFDRQLIPLLPYLAVLGGFGVAALLLLAQRRARVGVVIPLLVVACLAIPPIVQAVDWNIQAGKPDTRYAALDWIEAHVPPDATIAREWHTPPVEPSGYREIFIRKANDQPLAWYRAAGVDYLVLSSFMYDRYLDAPTTYPADAAFYQQLLAIPPAARFEGDNGPVIYIYELDAAAPAFE